MLKDFHFDWLAVYDMHDFREVVITLVRTFEQLPDRKGKGGIAAASERAVKVRRSCPHRDDPEEKPSAPTELQAFANLMAHDLSLAVANQWRKAVLMDRILLCGLA